ncbi:MAG: hypothetical protein ACRDZS_05500 [Acidimicrobiales bacterium]
MAESRQLEAGGPPLLTGADGGVRHRRVFSSGELRRWARILHRYRAGGDGKLIALRGDLLGEFFGQTEPAMQRPRAAGRDRPMRFGAHWCQYW